MRTRLALLLAASLAAPLAARAAPEAGWWTQRLSYGEGPMLIENLWSKGRRMRAESVFNGIPIVTLVDERRYVIIDVTRHTGVSIARSPVSMQQDAKRPRPFGYEVETLLARGAEKVGSEVRAGQDVDHYRITSVHGDRDEIWVTQDELQLPMEELFRDRETGAKSQRVYLRWVQVGLPDEFFRPGPGVKLEEISYEEYVESTRKGQPPGPAPPLYSDLLHGRRE
jgi:hypothetical protein